MATLEWTDEDRATLVRMYHDLHWMLGELAMGSMASVSGERRYEAIIMTLQTVESWGNSAYAMTLGRENVDRDAAYRAWRSAVGDDEETNLAEDEALCERDAWDQIGKDPN